MIFCSQCQHENRDNARFCAQCGTALVESAGDEAWSRQNEPSSYPNSSYGRGFDSNDTGPLEEDVIDFTFPSPDEDDFYDLRSPRSPRRRREERYRRSRASFRTRSSRSDARRSRRRNGMRSQPPRVVPPRRVSSSWDDRWDNREDRKDNRSQNRYDSRRYAPRSRRRRDEGWDDRRDERRPRTYRPEERPDEHRTGAYRSNNRRSEQRPRDYPPDYRTDERQPRDYPPDYRRSERQPRDYPPDNRPNQRRTAPYQPDDRPNRGQRRDYWSDERSDEQQVKDYPPDNRPDERRTGAYRPDNRPDEHRTGAYPPDNRPNRGQRRDYSSGEHRTGAYPPDNRAGEHRTSAYPPDNRPDEHRTGAYPPNDGQNEHRTGTYPPDDRPDEHRTGPYPPDDRENEQRTGAYRPDERQNERRRRAYRSNDRPDNRSNQRRSRRSDSKWTSERNRSSENQRGFGYERARSVSQGSGFTTSSLSTANLREINSEDYENVPVTNGRPYPDEPTPTPFVARSKTDKIRNREYSSPPRPAQQEVQDHQEWAPTTRIDAQKEEDSDYGWQAHTYPTAKREASRDASVENVPETEPAQVRTESDKSRSSVTVVPNKSIAQPTRDSTFVRQPTHEIITEPLSPPTGELSPLPIGELLQKRRYVIISLLEQTTTQNIYLVKDRLRRQCMICGSGESEKEATQCQTCGTVWLEQSAELPRYLLREVFDQNNFEKQAALISLALHHPRLVLPLAAFSENVYGPTARFYLLSQVDEGYSLATLSRPQPETQVLSWGQQVADGLIYLHEQEVACQQLDLEQVMLVEGQAKLSDLSHAQQITAYAPATWQANEVDALGDMLFKLLDPHSLSPPTNALFERFAHSQDRFLTMHTFAEALDETLQQLHEQMKVTHLVGQATDIGQQRKINEDHLLTLKVEHAYLGESRPIGLYLVADGIGGQAAGEIASQLAASTIAQQITSKVMLNALSTVTDETENAELQVPDYASLLKDACLCANEVLHEHRLQANNDMGTTVVAALVVDHQAYIANVGDSRAYFIHQGQISQLTTDHSLVGRLLSLGQITPEQARTHPQRHVIYRTLGDKPQVEIDIVERKMQPGDALVLCTDGLYGMVNEALIQQQAIQAAHPQAACEELVLLANQAGGEDNIAVIVIQIEEVG